MSTLLSTGLNRFNIESVQLRFKVGNEPFYSKADPVPKAYEQVINTHNKCNIGISKEANYTMGHQLFSSNQQGWQHQGIIKLLCALKVAYIILIALLITKN